MSVSPILLIVWATLAACFLALLAYRGQLTRYEDEQLFLNEEVNLQEKHDQEEIIRRVNRITPIVNICGGAAGLVTMSVIGVFVWDAWQRLH